ncbi:hypothetical protein ACQP0C_19135 [Nocardia sp. CA-129566]|uniref:hypothetical protein n=1 Tax=Nocardia sp. CA-129566 TaxID=3239976 RepID=UPI003D9946D7
MSRAGVAHLARFTVPSVSDLVRAALRMPRRSVPIGSLPRTRSAAAATSTTTASAAATAPTAPTAAAGVAASGIAAAATASVDVGTQADASCGGCAAGAGAGGPQLGAAALAQETHERDADECGGDRECHGGGDRVELDEYGAREYEDHGHHYQHQDLPHGNVL